MKLRPFRSLIFLRFYYWLVDILGRLFNLPYVSLPKKIPDTFEVEELRKSSRELGSSFGITKAKNLFISKSSEIDISFRISVTYFPLI